MEYRVEITIPEAREDVFMAIFEALVDEPNSVAAVGEMKTTGAPSHIVIALDAVDAHAASVEAVRRFREAVAKSRVDGTADVTIVDLHAGQVSDEELLDSEELQPA
jgi:hypothetical protein